MVQVRVDRALVWAAGLTCLLATKAGQSEEPLPDLEFLEYLGSFAEDEADWLTLAGEAEGDALAERLAALNAQEKDDATNEETDDE